MKRTYDDNGEAEHSLIDLLENDIFQEIRKNLSLLDLFVMTQISSGMRILLIKKLASSFPKLTLSYPEKCSPCGHQYTGHNCTKPSVLQAPCLSGKNVIFLDEIGHCRPRSLSIKSLSLVFVDDISRFIYLEIVLDTPVLRDTSDDKDERAPREKEKFPRESLPTPRFEAYRTLCLRRVIGKEETTLYYGKFAGWFGKNDILYKGKINIY